MPRTVRAIRGATTVAADTTEDVRVRVVDLLQAIMERNGLVEDDIVSILFTATGELVSTFPATAARSMGLGPSAHLRPGAVDRGLPAAVHPGDVARGDRAAPPRDPPRLPRGRRGPP